MRDIVGAAYNGIRMTPKQSVVGYCLMLWTGASPLVSMEVVLLIGGFGKEYLAQVQPIILAREVRAGVDHVTIPP